jgi:hypothetical protein
MICRFEMRERPMGGRARRPAGKGPGGPQGVEPFASGRLALGFYGERSRRQGAMGAMDLIIEAI